MAIYKIEDFFCIRIEKYPSLPPNNYLVQNWSIVLAYLNKTNHTAQVYEPHYPPDCKNEVDRAVHTVSSFFLLHLIIPALGFS